MPKYTAMPPAASDPWVEPVGPAAHEVAPLAKAAAGAASDSTRAATESFMVELANDVMNTHASTLGKQEEEQRFKVAAAAI